MKKLFSLLLLLSASVAFGQNPWTGILTTARADTNWPNVGAQTIPGSLPAPCATQPSSNTPAAVNAAFTADAGGGSYCTINIPAGTYDISGTFVLKYAGIANVVLNGAGPNQTFFVWTGQGNHACNGLNNTNVCVYNGDGASNVGTGLKWANTTAITGGLTQGSTALTLSSTNVYNSLRVGELLQIGQTDHASDTGNVWYCSDTAFTGSCSAQGGGFSPAIPRATFTGSISGNTLTVSSVSSGTIQIGQVVSGSNINGNTVIIGGGGTSWTLNISQTVSSESMTGSFTANLNQEVYVVSCGTSVYGANCTSNTVTISSPIKSADWSMSNVPTAWWPATMPIENVGVQNISFDVSGVTAKIFTECHDCKNVWFSNDRFINGTVGGQSATNILIMWQNVNVSIFDSYMYGSNPSSQGYGIDWDAGTSDSIAYNNIAQHIATPYMIETGSGDVYAYNFATDNYFGSGWQQCDHYAHAGGTTLNLFEGGDGICLAEDDIHGNANYNTYYRMYESGFNPATYNFNVNPPVYEPIASGGQNYYAATVAAGLNAGNRYANIVASVLGTPGYHTTYNNVGVAGSPNSCPGYTWKVIYTLGFGNNQIPFSPACLGTSFTIDNDNLTTTTLMRWGNWDSVHNSVQENSSETASSAPLHPGLASPSTSFPSSFIFNSTPSWWQFPNGITAPFPANGPDVTGGVSNLGGHHYANPANNCYHNVMGGLDNGSSGPLTFNPNACFASSTPTAAQPTFSPVSPYTGPATTVTLSSATSGATITYCQDTLNTCTPSTPGSSVSFISTGFIRAFATKAGFLQSPTSSWSGTLSLPVLAAPTYSAGTGNYLVLPTVTITCPVSATCGFTTDGSTPTGTSGTITHGTVYTSPVPITISGTTLKSIATQSGHANSPETDATYIQTSIVLDVQSSFDGGPPARTTATCPSVSPTAGDGVVVEAVFAPALTGTVSDGVNPGNYSTAIGPNFNTAIGSTVQIFYRSGVVGTATAPVLTLSGPGTYVGVSCQWYKAVGGVFTLDATQQQPGVTANPTSGPPLTPTFNNELVVGSLITNSQIPSSPGSGYTFLNLATGAGLYPEYQIQSTKTATNTPYPLSADSWTNQMATFLFVSGTPTVTSVTGAATLTGTTGVVQ